MFRSKTYLTYIAKPTGYTMIRSKTTFYIFWVIPIYIHTVKSNLEAKE